MRFKIDWASLIVGSKFTIFALFYFVFETLFQVQAPGELIFVLPVWGLIFGGAYIWRGLYIEGLISEFYGIILILFVDFQLVVVPVTDAVVSACRVFPVRH